MRDNDIKVSEAEIESTVLELRQNAGITSEEEFLRQLAAEGITLDELKETLEKQTLVRRVMRSEVFSKLRVTETEIKQYYLDNEDLFKTVESKTSYSTDQLRLRKPVLKNRCGTENK